MNVWRHSFSGFNGYAAGAAETFFARLKRDPVLTPSSENFEQIASFRAFWSHFVRPRVTDKADSRTALSTPYRGSRPFKRRQLRERRRSWRETFDRAWSSIWERRKDAVEKELFTRVSSPVGIQHKLTLQVISILVGIQHKQTLQVISIPLGIQHKLTLQVISIPLGIQHKLTLQVISIGS